MSRPCTTRARLRRRPGLAAALPGKRSLLVGLAAACAIAGLVTSAGPVAASASAHDGTAARAGTSRDASTTAPVSSAASRRRTLIQLAMLRERAHWAEHGKPAQRGAITGTVVGYGGLPAAGACVTAIGSAGSVLAAVAPGGAFRLTGLPPGSYVLEYRHCTATGRYLTRWSGGADSRQSAARIQVTAGQIRHVPAMMLRPVSAPAQLPNRASWQRMLAAADGRGLSAAAAAKTGQIKGIVTGKGKPLRGICVITFPTTGGEGYGATTNKRGAYAIRHVPAGRYYVTFEGDFCPGNSNWLEQVYRDDNNPFGIGGNAVKVSSGKATANIDGHLRLGGEISGAVTSRSGRKLAGICVTTNGQVAGGFIGLDAQTARNGSYHLHALFPGKYPLQFSIGCGSKGNYAPASHRAIRIKYGQDATRIDVALGAGGTISGKVTLTSRTGKPLRGICVDASNYSGSVDSTASTDAAGEYRAIGLATGRYEVQFQPGCNSNGNYTSADATAHATAGKVTKSVNAVLQRGATISGVVTDSHGRPIAGLCIDLQGNDAYTANVPDSTDDNGSYVINQLPAGTYQVGFSGGCGNSGSYAPYWYDNESNEGLATPIKLRVGGTFTADAQLQPGATIAGKVTSASGRRLSGICVYVATETDAELGAVFQALAVTQYGKYSIPDLAPGQYLVNFGCQQDQAYANQWFGVRPGAGQPELVSAGPGRTGGIDGVLSPAGTITGAVTSSAGRPLTGVCVTAATAGQPASMVTGGADLGAPVTESRGHYQVSGLAAGRYRVAFSPCQGSARYASLVRAAAVRVRAGKTTRGIDARLPVGGAISGRVVTAAGKPLANICIFATDNQTGFVVVAITGKAGAYTVPGLATGSYVLEIGPCTVSQNLISVLRPARVTQPHATRGVNVTLHPGGTVAGVVTATSSGAPVPYICVEVDSSNPANPGSIAFTGADGSYHAVGLAAGSYRVYFGDPLCFLGTPGLAPQWYDDQPAQATARPVSVTVGQTTSSINAALQPDGGITGTVSGPSGSRVSGACVTAVPQPAASSARIVAVSKPGGYTLADLVPGRYKVEFSSGCGAAGYASQWWKDASSQTAAKVITIVAGQDVSGISATLSR